MRIIDFYFVRYRDYAGLEISVILRIALLFSRQIANVSAGHVLALESMGAKRYFGCHSLNIALKYKSKREKVWFCLQITSHDL